MFNAEVVTQSLFGRLGWIEQNPPTLSDGTVIVLSDENKASRSGRYFQHVHRAMTLKNICDTIEEVNTDNDGFNEYLRGLQVGAIQNSISAVLNEDTLIEQSMVFNRRSDRQTSVCRISTKRGYKIDIAADPSYCCVISSLSLLFAEAGTFDVVFMHSNAGVLSRESVTVAAGVEMVVPVEWRLSYSSDRYKGGFFYVYFETDLLHVEPDCPDFNRTSMFSAQPFEGNDLNNPSITSDTYGLNLEICSYRDFTQIIKNNQHVFDTLIGLQMAATVIELIINSTRSNRTERITKDAVAALYTDLNQMFPTPEVPYSVGIRGQIAREVKRVKNNLLPKPKNKISTPCFF